MLTPFLSRGNFLILAKIIWQIKHSSGNIAEIKIPNLKDASSGVTEISPTKKLDNPFKEKSATAPVIVGADAPPKSPNIAKIANIHAPPNGNFSLAKTIVPGHNKLAVKPHKIQAPIHTQVIGTKATVK